MSAVHPGEDGLQLVGSFCSKRCKRIRSHAEDRVLWTYPMFDVISSPANFSGHSKVCGGETREIIIGAHMNAVRSTLRLRHRTMDQRAFRLMASYNNEEMKKIRIASDQVPRSQRHHLAAGSKLIQAGRRGAGELAQQEIYPPGPELPRLPRMSWGLIFLDFCAPSLNLGTLTHNRPTDQDGLERALATLPS